MTAPKTTKKLLLKKHPLKKEKPPVKKTEEPVSETVPETTVTETVQ